MKAVVDRDLCIGCGLCVEICPQVFVMDDDNVARVIIEPVPDDAKKLAKDAADACPVNAIPV